MTIAGRLNELKYGDNIVQTSRHRQLIQLWNKSK